MKTLVYGVAIAYMGLVSWALFSLHASSVRAEEDAKFEHAMQLKYPEIRITSKVKLVEALFRAARNPSHKNCGDLGDVLVEASADDALTPKTEVHLDEDMLLLREFLTTECKDGVKRK